MADIRGHITLFHHTPPQVEIANLRPYVMKLANLVHLIRKETRCSIVCCFSRS